MEEWKDLRTKRNLADKVLRPKTRTEKLYTHTHSYTHIYSHTLTFTFTLILTNTHIHVHTFIHAWTCILRHPHRGHRTLGTFII